MAEETSTNRISRERRRVLLARLKSEIGPHKRDLYIAAFFAWIQFSMRILSFFLIAKNIEAIYLGKAISVWYLVGQLLLLALIGFLAALVAKNYQGSASQFARNNLKRRFFAAFQGQGGDFGKETSVADVMTVASQGIDSLDTYFHHYLMTSLRTYLNCATILLLVVGIYPIGGVIFLACLPLIPVSIILMQKRSKRIMNHYWGTYMDVGNLFMDDLKGMNTLYTYDADERYEKSFVQRAEEFRQSTMQLLYFQLQSVGYMDGVMYLGVGLSGFAAAVSLASGNLDILNMIFFVLIAAEFFAPIREMGYGMHLVMMNTKMADRIYTFLDSVEIESGKEILSPITSQISTLTFEDVSFSYGKSQIFSKLNFTISRGSIFAIAGESGLGKSTLAKLIQKQLRINEGEIYFNQTPLSAFSSDSVRQNVMYVSPDSYLFNQSIYENLLLGADLSEKEVLTWLKQHHFLTFIDQLPEGIHTIVGENGNLLSPGQRQQIICARALLANRSIYIFDEMTSSVDGESESVIFNYITLMADRAIVIFISHKTKQVVKADQVLFIDRPHNITLASPKELLPKNSEFKSLVETQKELESILHG